MYLLRVSKAPFCSSDPRIDNLRLDSTVFRSVLSFVVNRLVHCTRFCLPASSNRIKRNENQFLSRQVQKCKCASTHVSSRILLIFISLSLVYNSQNPLCPSPLLLLYGIASPVSYSDGVAQLFYTSSFPLSDKKEKKKLKL